MFQKSSLNKITIGNDLKIDILNDSGTIYDIYNNIFRLKQIYGDNYETPLANIYIRVKEESKVYYTHLIGVNSPSSFKIVGNKVFYKGEFREIKYEVILSIVDKTFFFEVKLYKNINTKQKIKIFYGLDFSISDLYAIRSNEAYVSQYIDHKAFLKENGYIVCSRQNQGQNYYLEQASLTKNIGYSTDAVQFFGLDYKINQKIKALEEGKLDNEIYQYECSYCALESEEINLEKENKKIIFYCSLLDKIDDEIKEPLLEEKVKELYLKINNDKDNNNDNENINYQNPLNLVINYNNILNSKELDINEFNEYYPNRLLEEYDESNKNLMSFFLDNHAYVTMPYKERILERPTGNILISANFLNPEMVLASTCYIYGVFNSQIICGNTSYNKLLSNQRNFLNLKKISGQRIFIKLKKEEKNCYYLLNMPAVFENGLNYCRWLYKINNDVIEIISYVACNEPKLKLQIKSKNNIKYDFLITNEITMSQNERETTPIVEYIKENNQITFKAKNAMVNAYENFNFKMILSENFILNNDSIFFNDNKEKGEQIITISLTSNSFDLTIIGDTFGEIKDNKIEKFEIETNKYLNYYQSLLKNLNFSINNNSTEKRQIESLNHLIYWYTHDMIIHFSSPHGLEQYNGAAWGTRDVCQGPSEYFMATRNFEIVRKIILEVYKHQFFENGDWPQWFMFDRFYKIQDHHSHGDIIVWPARTLGLYLKATNDFSILKEKVPYMERDKDEYTNKEYTILEHLEKEVESICNNFIPNTYLSCYGGGDWDDTLQPANKEYTKKMVSGWTVALTYEMFKILGEVLENQEKKISENYLDIAKKIEKDYMKYIYNDNTPAGFILFEKDKIRKIIHPSDIVTNMKYRLLPFNRGIISEMFSISQMKDALNNIDEHLSFPDGVRLMDRTVPYNGGKKTYFERAETASNFGREISLQYCHAHIRYVEALTKANDKRAYNNLMKINPILITENVKNALPRQRNSYFSSSDACFKTRYEAMTYFDKLKTQEIKVKSGWRVYSSGPGIFLNQLITNVFGIKVLDNSLVLDPCLPDELSGLTLKMDYLGKNITITFNKSNIKEIYIDNYKLDIKPLKHKYKESGYTIKSELLKNNSNIVIYY